MGGPKHSKNPIRPAQFVLSKAKDVFWTPNNEPQILNEGRLLDDFWRRVSILLIHFVGETKTVATCARLKLQQDLTIHRCLGSFIILPYPSGKSRGQTEENH